MERRRYLKSVAVGLGAVVAGCSGGDPGDAEPNGTDDSTTNPGETAATPSETPTPRGTIPDAPVAGSMTGWERRSYVGPDERTDDPPSVDFDAENDRLYVRGVIVVGSSSCKEASVEEVGYDDGELYVYVLHDWKESVRDETPRECTDDISQAAYEVEVTFDDGLPARVVAEERDHDAAERRRVYER